jgi:flagellar biosynthesis protein FlhA
VGYIAFRDIAKSVRVYTILTIGDGLVTQVPALLISIASGIIVTRSTAEKNLGRDFFSQIFSQPRSLFMVVGFLIVMFFAGFPTVPLLIVMAACTGVAVTMVRGRHRAAVAAAEQKAKDTPKKPERIEALLHVDPMGLEVGYGLIKLVDAAQGGDLLNRVTMIRRQAAAEMGFIVPPIRIRDNMQLEPDEYVIKIRGVKVAGGKAVADGFLAMDAGTTTGKIEGVETKEPAFGLPAVWITAAQRPRAEALGYTVVDATTVIATHLSEVIKSNASEILTREDVNHLLENLKETSAALVASVVPDVLKISDVHRVLQNLLKERVAIRDLGGVLETLGDYGPRTKDAEILAEYCRHGLARLICEQYTEKDGKIYVVTLDPRLEDKVNSCIERTERGTFLNMSPKDINRFIETVSKEIEKLVSAGHAPVVLCSPQIRAQVKRIMDTTKLNVAVLSYNEIVTGVAVESLGTTEYKE